MTTALQESDFIRLKQNEWQSYLTATQNRNLSMYSFSYNKKHFLFMEAFKDV